MLINNSYVAGLKKETAAAVYSTFRTIAGTMVFIFRAAFISVLCGVLEIYMAFRYAIWIIHIGTGRRAEKQV